MTDKYNLHQEVLKVKNSDNWYLPLCGPSGKLERNTSADKWMLCWRYVLNFRDKHIAICRCHGKNGRRNWNYEGGHENVNLIVVGKGRLSCRRCVSQAACSRDELYVSRRSLSCCLENCGDRKMECQQQDKACVDKGSNDQRACNYVRHCWFLFLLLYAFPVPIYDWRTNERTN
jgi:hypothetical protein